MSLKLPKSRIVETNCSLIKRFLAFVLDLMILDFVVFFPMKKVLSSLIPQNMALSSSSIILGNNPDLFNKILIIMVYLSLVAVIYFSVLEYKFQQTIGKMILKIYIKSNKLSFWKFVLSNLTLIPVFPFIILWVVDPLYLFFKGQRFMEQISNITLVERVAV